MATTLEYIFLSIILTYFLGAIFSLIYNKNDKHANLLSNFFNIFASILGIMFALIFLLYNYIFNSNSALNHFSNKLNFGFKSSIEPILINFHIDNLSVFFILLISAISLIVSIYSIGYLKHYYNKRNLGYFGFLYNMFILSMILVVTSGQLFFFLIVWEFMALISYFLIVYESEKVETQKAGIMYVIMTHIGTAFLIAAFILIYKYCSTVDLGSIDPSKIPDNIKNIIFIFVLVGFGTKAGVIPLHVWLPKAYTFAPSNISALMSGLMSKTAVYGIIRIVIGILGAKFLWWGTVILILGAISTILGIAYALMEINIKRLLAYSSVENMGIILIGMGLAIMSYSNGNYLFTAFALTASLLHVFNHSIFKSLLFLGAGAIHISTKTRNIEKLGGLIKKMPYTAILFLIGALSISSIPPFNGFVSEWLTYQSLFVNVSMNQNYMKIIIILIVALLAMAGVLAAFSFIKAFGLSFLAKPRSIEAEGASEVPKSMLTGMAIPAVLCIVIGILPLPFIKIIDTINFQLLNISIMKNISDVGSFVSYPISIEKSSIAPQAIVILAVAIILIVLYFVAFNKIKTNTRQFGTWDCGYKQLTPNMQYTATGFSKPIRIIFRAIYRPQRELEIDEGTSPYFVKSGKYEVSIQSILEKYVYDPLIKRVINFARRARFLIQTGSIHTYLIYIFIVIVAMFIYYIRIN